MANKDALSNSISEWFSETAQNRAGQSAGRIVSGKISEVSGMPDLKSKKAAAGQMGLDPEMAKATNKYLEAAVKIENQLQRIILEHNVEYKEALNLLERQAKQMRGVSKESDVRIRKELKVIDLLNKQYKIQRKKELIEKATKVAEKGMGKTSAKLLKHAVTGGGPPGGGGPPSGPIGGLINKIPVLGAAFKVLERVLAGVAGLITGSVVGSFNLLLSSTKFLFEQMNVAFTGGIRGVLTATKNIMMKGFDLLAKIPKVGGAMKKIGGTMGAIANVMISTYMFKLEDAVARSKAMVKAEARTGATTEESGAAQKRMMGVTGLRGRTQEWLDAMSDTGTIGKAGQNLESNFYRMGQTMAISASETAQYFNQMLMMSGDTTTAMKDMGHMFQVSKDAAKKTTLSTIEVSKAISDASLNSRMLNVDAQSVASTMGMLADKQKVLGQFGVDLKSQGPGILKTLTGMGQGWDMATHSFAGMLFYGEKYQEQTGKQLDIGKAYLMSRYGEKGGGGFKMEGGVWKLDEKQGAKAFQVGTGELSERLEKIQQYAIEQTAGIKDDGERMMAQKMILKDVFKIQDENAQTALMTTQKGDFKKLAQTKQMQMSMMSQNEITRRTLSVQEKSEGIQRRIMRMMQSVIMLIILLPIKLADLLGEISIFSDVKKATVGGKTVAELGQMFNQNVGNVITDATALFKVATTAVKSSVPAKHYGGLLKANELARMQFGESAQLNNDEFLFMGNKPMNITPRYEMAEKLAAGGDMAGASITNAGGTTYINITVPSNNPDEVADALRQHLARIS